VFLAPIMRPAAQKRSKTLLEQGFHKSGDVEERWPSAIAPPDG